MGGLGRRVFRTPEAAHGFPPASYAWTPVIPHRHATEANGVRNGEKTSIERPVRETVGMAFGQQLGPPATARQLQDLLTLLKEAGHSDFRDARGPMAFTQRQAGGKFTRDEADSFIERLRDSETGASAPIASVATPRLMTDRAMRALPADQLADELRRRGWIVIEP
jgi:hypothetical protein